MQLVQYLYVKNDAVNWIDLLGLIGTVSQLYVNGNKYDNVAILYDDSTWIKTSALESILKAAEITGGKIGYEPVVDVVTGAAPKPNSPYTIPKRGYYERGNTRVYFTKLDGECHIQLRDIARLGDVEITTGTPSSEALLASYFYEEIAILQRRVCGASIILVQ